jgi:4-amino-4-deoxy-L-arabinose transferase-like glycosyltransferase
MNLKYKKFLIIFAIVLIGAFLRFYRLGDLPIEGDNSFHAIAVRSILESGLPEMPSGEIYKRAILLNYLEALSVKCFGFSEWSLRFPNALIGTINIILVYFLVWSFLKANTSALLSALLFSLSPWAITMARMPRMYETLLMTVMVCWICFYHWYYLKKQIMIVPLVIVALIALTLHEIAILALTCFMAPLLLERRLRRDTIVPAGFFSLFLAFWCTYDNMLMGLIHCLSTS